MTKTKKTIVITGTSNGFGKVTAITLAKQGHKVYATMRQTKSKNASAKAELIQLANDENLDLHVQELDVTDDVSVKTAFENIAREAGEIDVLVNNAGIVLVGVTEAYTIEQAKQQFDVNLFGIIRTTREVLPHMREQKSGLIINFSSVCGRLAFPFFSLYCASKYAVEGLTESYSYELSEFGINMALIEPGPFDTNIMDVNTLPSDQKRLDAYGDTAHIPPAMLDSFKESFKAKEAINDPQIAADKVAELVNSETKPPLRNTIGIDFGTSQLNDNVLPTQKELLQALGMEHMA